MKSFRWSISISLSIPASILASFPLGLAAMGLLLSSAVTADPFTHTGRDLQALHAAVILLERDLLVRTEAQPWSPAVQALQASPPPPAPARVPGMAAEGLLARLLAAPAPGEAIELWRQWLSGRLRLPPGFPSAVRDSAAGATAEPALVDTPLARALARALPAAAQAQAWLVLGRERFHYGHYRAAAAALARAASPDLTPAQEAERRVLLAQIRLLLEQPDEALPLVDAGAGRRLPPPWPAYAGLTRAAALAAGEDAAVEAEIDAALASAGRQQAQAANDAAQELEALQDLARLLLGRRHLAAGRPDAARDAFQGVHPNGPFADAALLGLGWAEWLAGEPRLAQAAWRRLAAGPAERPEHQEAMLGLPQALWRLGSHTQAVKGFREAIALYERQRSRLRRFQTQEVRGLLEALAVDEATVPPQTPMAPYLEKLWLQPRFQALLARHRLLHRLQDRLQGPLASRIGAAQDADLEARRAALLARSRDLHQALLQGLEGAVGAALERHRRRLQDYLVTARYQLARLLDELSREPSPQEEPPS